MVFVDPGRRAASSQTQARLLIHDATTIKRTWASHLHRGLPAALVRRRSESSWPPADLA